MVAFLRDLSDTILLIIFIGAPVLFCLHELNKFVKKFDK